MWYHRQELTELYQWKTEPRQNLDDGKYIVKLEFVPTSLFDFYWYGMIWILQTMLVLVI